MPLVLVDVTLAEPLPEEPTLAEVGEGLKEMPPPAPPWLLPKRTAEPSLIQSEKVEVVVTEAVPVEVIPVGV